MFGEKTKLMLVLAAVATVGATFGILRAPRTVGGQNATGGSLYVNANGADAAIEGHQVMVSVLRDGALVKQSEISVGGFPYSSLLPVGSYDVRAEGDGIVTLEKRGIHVTPGDITSVRMVLRAGQGVHIVEYAAGALSREQIASSIRSLEARVSKLEGK